MNTASTLAVSPTMACRGAFARLLRAGAAAPRPSTAVTCPAAPLAGLGASLGGMRSKFTFVGGKSVFVKAAVDTVEAQTTDAGEKVIPLPTSDESEELLRIRHSSAHLMAAAVQKVVKGAKCTIGPWIERGFYYDFDIPEPLTEKDLKKVKKEMRRLINKDLPFIREEVSADEARERIAAIEEPYKMEILEDIVKRDPEATITIYHIGEKTDPNHWWDLCAGPHVESTGKICKTGFDLEKVAGAYWRGDENNAQLQRIYGTAWESADQLEAYYHLKEEAARRDHRKIGKELNLFSIQEGAGGGLVFWHPKGALIRHMIEDYWKKIHLERGYSLMYTPHIAKLDLWKTSGHFDFYGENMFDQMDVEEEQYQLRPMNCPFHICVYNDTPVSYRDLPLRWAELGTVYRYERSGTMHGLFRVRGFTQDDAHVFCMPDQIAAEIRNVLDLTEDIMRTFGFNDYEINLSTRPEKSVGSEEIWDVAENALVEALDLKGWEYVTDVGGGAFYGPKIDIKIFDAIGRKWQCSTVQLDFNLPERFGMEYMASDGTKQRPIMIHRAIFGSIERFFGILTESYAGAYPLWLAPTQVRVLPVTDQGEIFEFAQKLVKRMEAAGIRVDIDHGQRVPKLVRNAETTKIPVMCIVGAREMENDAVAVRTYADGDLGAMGIDDIIARIKTANETNAISF